MLNNFWIDTNIVIKFNLVDRLDILSAVLPTGSSLNFTGNLIVEYQNRGLKTDFQYSKNYDHQNQLYVVVSNSTSTSISCGDNAIKAEITNPGCASLSTSSNMPIADQEGIWFGLQGTKLLTDDFKHIRKYEKEYNLTCTGATGIVIASYLKGITCNTEADSILKTWKNHDRKWVAQNYSSFVELLRDESSLSKIKSIFFL